MRTATAARREDILRAGRSLFAANGFRATSIEDICARSGASVGSVYHHFGSKEGVAAALYVEAMVDYQRGLRDILEQPVAPEVAVPEVVEHYLRWMEAHPESALLMLAVEHADIRELAADQIARLNAPVVDLVEEWAAQHVKAHRLPDVPLDLLVAYVVGPARRFAHMWLQDRTEVTVGRAIDLLPAAAWHGLLGLLAEADPSNAPTKPG